MAVDRLIWKIILDFVILAFFGVLLLLLMLYGTPYERGYFVDDESLRLPYKQQTISEAVLAGIGFAIIVVTVLIVEFTRDKRGKGVGEKFLSGSLVAGWVWQSYNCIGIYTFGAASQQLTSNIAKYVIGRLRPHFFDVCNPVPNASSTLNTLGYIQDYSCFDESDPRLKDMRLSFPSAHSSFAMYTAVFFIFYLQVKTKWRGSKLLRHAVQFAALMGAWYVGLSRVVDHMHHWSDVAVGFAIGATFAVLTFVFVLKIKRPVELPTWDATRPENILPRPVLTR